MIPVSAYGFRLWDSDYGLTISNFRTLNLPGPELEIKSCNTFHIKIYFVKKLNKAF